MLTALQNPSSFTGVPQLVRDIRVLLLDDSNFDRARIRRLSHRTDLCIELDEVESIAQMEDAVARENYDVILIDYRLPVGDGMQALDCVLQNDLNKDAGKIMITGDGASDTADQALRGGCHDFLSKEEMNAEALRRAMINAVTTARQQQLLWETRRSRARMLEAKGTVVSLVREGFSNRKAEQKKRVFGGANVEDLLARFGESGEFTVH